MGTHRPRSGSALGRRGVLTEPTTSVPGPQIAQVRVDVVVPHLDRPFDYAIPADLRDRVVPGVRVRVRFAGRLVNGFVTAVQETTEHADQLKPIDRVIGDEVVLRPAMLPFIEAVARHYGGTVHDVLRFAVPTRHARAEAAPPLPLPQAPEMASEVADAVWQAYDQGPNMLERVAHGQLVRATWSSAPASSWPVEVAALARSMFRGGGVIIVVPDAADAERLTKIMPDAVLLLADHGPERRYRAFLRVLRGHVSFVIGTRTAVFAPFEHLDGIIVWGDGDESLWEQQAPYWNARDVAAIRSHEQACSLVVGSPSRSPHVQAWCDAGWMVSITATAEVVRERAPIVQGLSAQDEARDEAARTARLPRRAWQMMKTALADGPVLVQVARRGYVPRLACQRCRTPVDCACGGPLELASSHAVPRCTWCGALAGNLRCSTCGGQQLRALAIGAERTAEEFGRAFPGTRIIASAGDHIVRSVGEESAIVIATQGAEPVSTHGYAAVIVLDANATLHRVGLRAMEDAAMRWFAAAVLARPRAPMFIAVPHGDPIVQALVRWQAPWLAERDLAERAAAGMPPATRLIVLRGTHTDITEVTSTLPSECRVLGPVDGRAMVLVPRALATIVIDQLRGITASRSARRSAGVVTVVVDPREP